MHNNNKRKSATAASGTTKTVDPESVKKLICIGPSMRDNYRVIAVLHNEKEIHYYMDARGNLYVPPKHTPQTLVNLKEATKEWDWVKRTWTTNNVPFNLFFKGNEKLRKNAFRALAQVRESRLASAKVQSINARNPKAKLGDISTLADIKTKLETAEPQSPDSTEVKTEVTDNTSVSSNVSTVSVVATAEPVKNYDQNHPMIQKFNQRYGIGTK